MISIIIPCYNHAHLLPKAIESCLKLKTPHEIIVINDGSTDNTSEVAKQYPVILLEQNNKGLSSARNLGISNAKYDLILPLDADDELIPESIDLAISTITSEDNIVYGNAILYKRQYIPTKELTYEQFLKGNQLYPTSIFKKNVWKDIGGYWEHPTNKSIFEDWDFWGRAIKRGFLFRYIDLDFYYYNRTNDGMCITLSKNQKINEKIIREHLIAF